MVYHHVYPADFSVCIIVRAMVRHAGGKAIQIARKYRRDKKGLPLLRLRQGDPLAHFVVVISALALAATRPVDIPARVGALALVANSRINGHAARPICRRCYSGTAIGFPPTKALTSRSGRLRCVRGEDVVDGNPSTSWCQQPQQQQHQVYTLLIDNYDSYTYNLFQQLAVVNGRAPFVVYNDDNDGNLRYVLVLERRCACVFAENIACYTSPRT